MGNIFDKPFELQRQNGVTKYADYEYVKLGIQRQNGVIDYADYEDLELGLRKPNPELFDDYNKRLHFNYGTNIDKTVMV